MKDTYQVWLVLERWNGDDKICEEITSLFLETPSYEKAEEAFKYIENATFDEVKKRFPDDEE